MLDDGEDAVRLKIFMNFIIDTQTRDLSAWRVTVPRLEARSIDGPFRSLSSHQHHYLHHNQIQGEEWSQLMIITSLSSQLFSQASPHPSPHQEELPGRSCFTFIIQVQRIDVASRSEGEDLEWLVERQYHEFYSLQSALVQYHGIFDDAKLPPR